MNVVLIDAGGANIGSLRYAFERLGVDARLSAEADVIASADRVVLPGVGTAAAGMARLHELDLVTVVRDLRQPLLGICLGMQLLFESSAEGEVECLGLLPGRVALMPPATGVRVPHMGWNHVQPCRAHPLLDGIDDSMQAYFVHSYAVPVSADAIGTCTHGSTFAAVVARGNCHGAQFHPERSAAVGARLLENFLSQAIA